MKPRERYIDIAKGLAIICIVFLHFEDGLLPVEVNVFIGSFMISMFYVTVGWLDAERAEPSSLNEVARKRWLQLGKPYLWWSGIIILFDCILWVTGYYDTYFIAREAYKTIILRGIGTLWFLPALFGGEIIWHYLKRRKAWMIILAIIVTTIYQMTYHRYFNSHTDTISRIIDAPFRTISNMLSAWIGVGVGYLFYKVLSKWNLWQWKGLQISAIGIMTIVFAFWASCHITIPQLWNYMAPLFGPLGFILLFKGCERWKILNYFEFWGRHSLVLMVTHYSFLMVLFQMLYTSIYEDAKMSGWPAILMFVACMVIEYPLTLLINRYIPFTLGKKCSHK